MQNVNVVYLKSTPIVASVLDEGKWPEQNLKVRQVLPTPESPITITLNVLLLPYVTMELVGTVGALPLLALLPSSEVPLWTLGKGSLDMVKLIH